MNNKKVTDKEYLTYIDDYFNILINNFKSATSKKIPYSEIYEMINELDTMINKIALNNIKIVGNLSINKYIPLLELLLKLDNNQEHAFFYEKCLKNAYKLSARVSFEHYMIFREWDEKDKFFMPRYNIMKGYAHYLQELTMNPKFETVIFNAPSGYGKLIANDIPVLTRDGWKKHGDLKVGDYVISPKGEFIRVNIVHPKRLANCKVIFEDGEEILCHNQHEWCVYDRMAKKTKERVETTYLMQHLKEKNGRNRFYIPLREIVKGEKKDLPVDPYTYGVWLGDGSTNQGRITQSNNDVSIFNYIPYEISNIYDGASENVKVYHLNGLAYDLHKLGLCYQNHIEEKYIHDSYLTASVGQRLELLAGIIDTDGYLDKTKQRYIIVTCGEKLKDDITSLISTFGWRVCVTTIPPKTSTSGIVGKKDTYYIGFNPTIKIPCKLERKKLNKTHKQRRIGIAKIELIRPTEGNCITVDGGLYLVGRTLKTTHNTYPEKINEAWSYGIDSTGTTLALCSNENVVLGGSRLVIDEIKSEPFGEVFPHLKYTKEDKDFFLKETAGEWKLRDCKLLASYYASTVKSNVVGSRASKIIHIDDLYADYNEAMNQELNELYFNKYLTVWSKRFVQNKIPKVCVTGTLWANGDFIARLIEYYKGIYKFKKDPKYPYTLINEEETVVIIQVPALDYITGESTCPEIKSTEQVLRDKDAMDDYLFQTNFQQVPTDPEALIFSWNKLRTYQKIPTSTEYSNVAVIDGTRKTGNDNFSMPIFKKMFNGDFFEFHLIDCIFSQTATKDLIPDIVEKIIKHKIKTLVIETNVDGGLKKVLQEKLAEKGYFQIDIIEIYSIANKQARIEDQKGNILRNLVFPAKHLFGFKSDVGKFLDNLVTYNNKGRNSHDDAPDSCAILTKELVDEGSAPAKAVPIKRPF